MDYYKILNVKEDASIKEIDNAYKDLISFYNPENNVSKLAYKKYREINKAYNVLKEIKNKELYNLSFKEEVKEDEEIGEFTRVTLNDFYKDNSEEERDINKFKDEIVLDTLSNYTFISVSVPYLYYLVNSEYEVKYQRRVVNSSDTVCPKCLGIGKVKKDEEVVYCPECLGSGKLTSISYKEDLISVVVKDRVIEDDKKLVIDFEFIDKEDYIINGNEINIKHVVTKDEYRDGIYYKLKKNDEVLEISKNDFSSLSESYVFLDKVINIEYSLTKYTGDDLKGYVLTDKDTIYLNPKDYSYSYVASDVCNYKVELNSSVVTIESLGEKGYKDRNGDLILTVIRVNNSDDLRVFFNKSIKKVSKSLFKLSNSFNNVKFSKNKEYSYDDKYIYLPSFAYKLSLKHYHLFKLIFILGYILVPLILFLIFGVSYIFFITSFIYLIIYLIGVNMLMEVKI